MFDSGVGGLSILRHIRARLPQERILYVSDARFSPYGGRAEREIEARALAIGAFLVERNVKAIVVACNTATAAAIAGLRSAWPTLHVVGVEPGLKPAASLSRSRIVGVLATESTLASNRFARLRDEVAAGTGVRFLLQPCAGLADSIEQGTSAALRTADLLAQYVPHLLSQGADTLVLGCTHYPFAMSAIAAIAQASGHGDVRLVDTGAAVARQLGRVLEENGLLQTASDARPAVAVSVTDPMIEGFCTGTGTALEAGFRTLLGLPVAVAPVVPPEA